jgi:hypothetical protein
VVVAADELLLKSTSKLPPKTLAVLVYTPVTFDLTTTANVVFAPTARLGTVHVIVLAALMQFCAVTNVTFAGSSSVMTKPFATVAPTLSTFKV